MHTLFYTCVLAIALQHGITRQETKLWRINIQQKKIQRNWRTVDHCSYQILDTGYFILYHRLKAVEKMPNKGVMWVDRYYFSRTANEEIYELNTDNLKKAFPLNHRFHYALDANFR